jgi:hypothetical protein
LLIETKQGRQRAFLPIADLAKHIGTEAKKRNRRNG